MSYYAQRELSFDLPASTVTRANGGFKEGDTDVIGRWVQRGTGNTVVLVDTDNRPLGAITRITGDKVAVAVGSVVEGKRGSNAAIGNGNAVTGARRQESASGTAERGFVSAAKTDSAANYSNSVGYVLSNSADVVANAAAGTVEVLLR